jgi:hypothetical protein
MSSVASKFLEDLRHQRSESFEEDESKAYAEKLAREERARHTIHALYEKEGGEGSKHERPGLSSHKNSRSLNPHLEEDDEDNYYGEHEQHDHSNRSHHGHHGGGEDFDANDYSRYSYDHEMRRRLRDVHIPKKMKLADMLLKLASEKADREVQRSLNKMDGASSANTRYTFAVVPGQHASFVAAAANAASSSSKHQQQHGSPKESRKSVVINAERGSASPGGRSSIKMPSPKLSSSADVPGSTSRKGRMSILAAKHSAQNVSSNANNHNGAGGELFLPELPELNSYLENLVKDVIHNCSRISPQYSIISDDKKASGNVPRKSKSRPNKSNISVAGGNAGAGKAAGAGTGRVSQRPTKSTVSTRHDYHRNSASTASNVDGGPSVSTGPVISAENTTTLSDRHARGNKMNSSVAGVHDEEPAADANPHKEHWSNSVGRAAYLKGQLVTTKNMKRGHKQLEFNKKHERELMQDMIKCLLLNCSLTTLERQELEVRKQQEDYEHARIISHQGSQQGSNVQLVRDASDSQSNANLLVERGKSLLWIQDLLTKRILSDYDWQQLKNVLGEHRIRDGSVVNLNEESTTDINKPGRPSRPQAPSSSNNKGSNRRSNHKLEESSTATAQEVDSSMGVSNNEGPAGLTQSSLAQSSLVSTGMGSVSWQRTQQQHHKRSAAMLATYLLSSPPQIGGHFPHPHPNPHPNPHPSAKGQGKDESTDKAAQPLQPTPPSSTVQRSPANTTPNRRSLIHIPENSSPHSSSSSSKQKNQQSAPTISSPMMKSGASNDNMPTSPAGPISPEEKEKLTLLHNKLQQQQQLTGKKFSIQSALTSDRVVKGEIIVDNVYDGRNDTRIAKNDSVDAVQDETKEEVRGSSVAQENVLPSVAAAVQKVTLATRFLNLFSRKSTE